MKLLSISLDPTMLDAWSSAANRQRAYFPTQPVEILVMKSGPSRTVELAPNITAMSPGGSSNVVALLRSFAWLWKHRRDGFDIVVSQDASFTGAGAWFFSRIAKIPFAVQLHGDYLDNPLWIKQRFLNRLVNPVSKWILRRADGVRCVSERLRKQAISQFHIKPERCISLPICTSLKLFSPDGDREAGGPFVLFVGRLIEEKEPFLFCEAMIPLMREMPDLTVVFAGEGVLRTKLEEKCAAEKVSDRVRFVGQLSPAQLARWYRSSVCLVHTAAWEGWGMPMIEAMACGCPVVTTDSGCAGEAVLDQKNGIVVPVGDVEGLRNGTHRLLREADFRERLSAAAVNESAHWSFEARAHEQADFYERIIKRK